MAKRAGIVSLIACALLMIGYHTAQAATVQQFDRQLRTVKGLVKDSHNVGLISRIRIRNKDFTQIIRTDEKGAFEMTVPSGVYELYIEPETKEYGSYSNSLDVSNQSSNMIYQVLDGETSEKDFVLNAQPPITIENAPPITLNPALRTMIEQTPTISHQKTGKGRLSKRKLKKN